MRLSKAAPPPRRVAAEDLNVAPWVQELPLAAPRRRFWAMAIDLLLVAIVSAILLPDRQPRENASDDDDEGAPVRVVAPKAASSMTPSEALALAARLAGTAASAASAATAPEATAASQQAAVTAAERAALDAVPNEVLLQQIRSLETQLAEARKPKAWYERGWRWLRGLVTGYGGSLLYFTLVPAFWRGQTVGKRLLGLRVVEITGKPMTIRLAFARYGGYFAGMVTGGFGLAQVLWDRNRQGLQDKVAHTIVVDERAAAKARGT